MSFVDLHKDHKAAKSLWHLKTDVLVICQSPTSCNDYNYLVPSEPIKILQRGTVSLSVKHKIAICSHQDGGGM